MRGAYPENSLSSKRGAVTSEVPRGILPAVSAEVVGAMDMTMTESFTFPTNEIVVSVIGVCVAPFCKLYMGHFSGCLHH